MVVVEDIGLITCEKGCCRPKCLTPHSRKRTGVLLSEPTHIEGEDEDQEDEVEYEKDCEECKQSGESNRGQTLKRMTHGWHDAHLHLEPMSRATLLNMRANTGKCDV